MTCPVDSACGAAAET